MKNIEILIPEVYKHQISSCDWENLEEIRIRSGCPLRMRYFGKEKEFWPKVETQFVEDILQRACHHSAYAYSDSIRQGYLTIEGGHRIGICGFGVTENGNISTIKDPSSVNIRIARQARNFAAALLPQICDSVLILGPPGSGKTTLLRDFVRILSDNRRQNIGLADERGEVSACTKGVNQLDVGSRTDVLVNIPKSKAIMMLLRTMNPSWIAVDEVTAPADIAAMEQASYCGVKLLATAHGNGMEDLYRRPLYRKLMETGVFHQIVVLKKDKTYTVEEVTI